MRRRYVGITAIGVAAAYVLLVRTRHLRWGATEAEFRGSLPGDDLIPNPDLTATRAITIRASADQVWPWIAQLGQGRGGFYSYDFLENLVGCGIHRHPEVSLAAAVVDRGRSLVLRGGVPMGKTPPPYDTTWAFVLRERQDGTTRLLVRERYVYTQRWAPLLVEPVEAVSFVMSQKCSVGLGTGRNESDRNRSG